MEKIKIFIQKWSGKKRVYVVLILILAILFFVLKPKVDESVVVDTVKLQNLESTVLATGEITSNVDLSLSFNSTGVVKGMKVSVGDKVSKGAILANLDGGSAYGAVKTAEGALKAAKAKYDKLVAGTSNEEIALAEVTLKNSQIDLENTKSQQNALFENAKKTLLNTDLEAISENNNTGNTAPTISGTYNGAIEGQYIITTYSTGAGGYFSVSGLSSGGGAINTSVNPLGNQGLYITFPSNFSTSANSTWTVDVPNKKSADYLTNLNALNSVIETKNKAIASAQALVDSNTAQLAVKRAAARTFELDLAEADVISAQGQMQSAQATYENTLLRAPASGTITKVNLKLGELAQAQQEAIVLQDVDNLYLEANINESNIIKIKMNQKVSFTIDSFGKNILFEGEVVHIDPSATITDGIVNYKIKVSILKTDSGLEKMIKPGMNADLSILIEKKDGVLVIPAVSIIEKDNKKYVNVIVDEKSNKYVLREVSVGIVGDGNLIEITSGLWEGEKIAIVSKVS